MPSGNRDETCPACGLAYRDFRSGFTFGEVFGFYWVDNPDPATWHYKRRRTILGKLHQIKRELWNEHLTHCAEGGSMKKEILARLTESVESRLKTVDPISPCSAEIEVLDVVGDYVDPPFLGGFTVAVVEGPGTLFIDLFERSEKIASWVHRIK